MYQSIKLLVYLIGVVTLAFTTVAAQTPVPALPEDILVLRDTTLYRFRAQTTQGVEQAAFTQAASATTVAELNLADPDIVSVGADRAKQFVYTVEVIARDNQEQPRPTMLELVQTNLATGERRVLMTQPGLFHFVPSPDGRYLLVTYFEPRTEYGGGWARVCILDLGSNECPEVKDFTTNPAGGQWISPTRLLILSWTHQLYTFDLVTNELVSHPIAEDQWFINGAINVPGTEQILLSMDGLSNPGAPNSFALYDLQTGQFTQLPYTALNTQTYNHDVDTLLFSSDGRYLLYAGLDTYALVEFATGQLITEFDHVFQASWLDDGRSLVLDSPNGIQVFDAVTRQTTTLAPSALNTVILN